MTRKQAWYVENRERILARNADNYRANKAAVLTRMRRSRLLARYGVSPEQVEQMHADQGGVCAICGQPLALWTKATHIDHDHATGEVRGLLCWGCNVGLGAFKDDTGKLLAAAAYLTKP